MRPLGNGVQASDAVSAPQTQLRLLISGGLPAPADAVKLLADYGISGIRQTWQAPIQAPSPPQNPAVGPESCRAQYPPPEQTRVWIARQFTGRDVDEAGSNSLGTPEGVDALQPLGAGAREVYSNPRPLRLLSPSPTEGGHRAAASAHERWHQPPSRFGRLTPQGSSEGLVDVYDVRDVKVLSGVGMQVATVADLLQAVRHRVQSSLVQDAINLRHMLHSLCVTTISKNHIIPYN